MKVAESLASQEEGTVLVFLLLGFTDRCKVLQRMATLSLIKDMLTLFFFDDILTLKIHEECEITCGH